MNFGKNLITLAIKCREKPLIDVNNYRPVSITHLMSEIFESRIEKKIFESKFVSHRNQFRLVKERRCNKAVLCFSSVVIHVRDIFCCSLDATKVFDRINHYYLFACLCEKGFPI